MVRYGLDIDFEKFMVAHGDAANLCNEFDAVNLRRRHRRPERYGITQLVSGTGVLVKVAFGNTGNSMFNGQHPVRSGLCIRVLHLEPIGRAAGTIGESLSASRCESSRAVTPSCGSGALMPLIRGMATLAASSSSAADRVCRHLSAARLRWYAHAPALLRCRPTDRYAMRACPGQ